MRLLGTPDGTKPFVKERSKGLLSQTDIEAARKAEIPLSYDPLQVGWVRSDCHDDLVATTGRPGWPSIGQLASRSAEISLRAWETSDVGQFRDLLDNPAVWTYLPAPYPGSITLDMAHDLIALSGHKDLHIVNAIIVDGKPVGQVRLEFTDDEPELSYWLGEPFWGRGIGKRAVQAFVQNCFDADPKLTRLIARAKPENIGSVRILEHAGFAQEGRSNASPEWIVLRCDRPAAA